MGRHNGRVLVIAGSDSSGGAGIEADQKVLAAHGCYAATATTALTAQNTLGVVDIHYTPPAFVKKQIETVLNDIQIDVIKTGMLASRETVEVVAQVLQQHKGIATIIDPVMVSTSGAQLLSSDAISTLKYKILPLTTVLCPNIPEAVTLVSESGNPGNGPQTLADLVQLAQAIQDLGPKYVLLKGGHRPLQRDGSLATSDAERQIIIDILVDGTEVMRIEKPYQSSSNTHGTGCSLASAIAANLSKGMEIQSAVRSACRYVEAAIRSASDMGKGSGPINHFHSNYILPFAPGHFLEYLLDRTDVYPAWQQHVEHQFVAKLADGTLPVTEFRNYLVQDYLYLVQFARANSLASYKAKTIEDIAASAGIVTHIHHEMLLHIDYCTGFGMTKEELAASEESQACTAYTRYVLDVGQSEDWLALQLCMAPCLIGYGQIAQRLFADPKTKREGNIYWKWIENYVADDYSQAVKVGSDLLERHAVLQSPSRIEELVKIFVQATKMETGFWNM